MENPFEIINTRLTNIETLLVDIQRLLQVKTEPIPEADRWLNLNEFCEYHPDKPAKATVYGWVFSSKVPHHKDGKKLRFLKSEVDLWLQTGRRKTNSEIQKEADIYTSKKRK